MSASRPGELAVVVEDLRIEVAGDAASTSSTRSRSGSGPARCSGSSASPARARRRSGWRCSGTRAAARAVGARAHLDRRPRDCSLAPDGAARALRGAIVSYVPQDPGSALNPRCASASSSSRCSRRTRFGDDDASRAPSASPRSLAEVAAALDRRVPAALPAPALGRPAAARRARDGVRVPAARDRARRADDRPRRDDAGARARRPCASCAARTASRRCTSATTSRWWRRSPTASPSCTPAGSSRSGRGARSSRARRTRTRGG